MSSLSTSSSSAQETVSSESSEASQNQSATETSRVGTKRVKNQPNKLTSKKKMSTAVKRSNSGSEEDDCQTNLDKPTKIPQKTATQNRWGANIWLEWAKRHNAAHIDTPDYTTVPEDLHDCTREDLGRWLPYLVEEVKRQDGTEYPYNSVYQICCAVKRFVNHNLGEEIDIFNRRDKTFTDFNAALDCKLEESSSSYDTSVRNVPDPITREDEEKLWKTGTFNMDTAQGLSFAVFFYNCKLFNIIGKVEHWNLTAEQYRVDVDSQSGRDFIEFRREKDKSTKSIRHIGNPSHPRCPVAIFKKYLSLIPTKGHFYRAPNIRPLDGSISFAARNIGYNRLRAYLKHMLKLARVDTSNRKISTFSLKGSNSSSSRSSEKIDGNFLLPLDPIKTEPVDTPDCGSNGLYSSMISNTYDDYVTMVSADDAYSSRFSSSPENITVVTPSDATNVTMVPSLNRSSWTQTASPYATPEISHRNESEDTRDKEGGIPNQIKHVIDYVRNTGGGRVCLELQQGNITKIQIDL